LTGLLSSAGYRVIGSPDPARARKLLASEHFSLALLAIPLQGDEAGDLVSALLCAHPPVKVLAIVTDKKRGQDPHDDSVETVALTEGGSGSLLRTVRKVLGISEN